MTNFDYIKTMDLEAFSYFLSTTSNYSESDPWGNWLNENYCKECPSIIGKCEGHDMEFAPCEMGVPCKFYGMEEQELIKYWLEQEHEIEEDV